MSQAILQLYQDPKLRGQVETRGLRYAVQHLSLQRAAEIIENRIRRIHAF